MNTDELLKGVEWYLITREDCDKELYIEKIQDRMLWGMSTREVEVSYFKLYSIYKFQGKYERAIKQLDYLLNLNLEIEDRIVANREYGLCKMKLGNIDEALYFLMEAYDLAVESEMDDMELQMAMIIGDYFVQVGELEEALGYFDSSIDIARKCYCKDLECLATIKKALVFNLMKKLNPALELLEDAEKIAVDCKDMDLKARVAVARYKIYAQMGDAKQAHEIMDGLFEEMYPHT